MEIKTWSTPKKKLVCVTVDEEFKSRAMLTDFKKLDRALPNGVYNVKDTPWYAPIPVRVCALYYFETGKPLCAFGGGEGFPVFYGFYE